MSLLSLFGCGPKNPAPAPDSADKRLKELHFSATHGYHAYSNIGYRAERTENGKTLITVEVGNDRDRVYEADGSVMDSLEAIVREYRMDRYDGHYKPKFDILDGDSWDFYIRFADGKSASCSGYMAYPPRGGAEALGKVEGMLSRWLYVEPAEDVALVSFRYELHNEEGSEVFYFKKNDSSNAVYFRNMGSFKGVNYNCGDSTLLNKMARDISYMHLGSYSGEDLSSEDTSRPRWIMIAEYADGTKYEKMDYLDREPEDKWRHNVPSFTEMGLRGTVESYFSDEFERIGKLSPEERGNYSVTSYDAKGKPQRIINYDAQGTVLGGRDYNNPDLDF